MAIISSLAWLLFALSQFCIGSPANSTFKNPTLPGWHSDPSCIFVAEEDNTYFCATSTFLATPGVPIYASKDLVNWKLASHVITRQSQMPYTTKSVDQNDGIFAPTLRYHKGIFYVVTVYVYRVGGDGTKGLIYKSKNPYKDSAWSEPVHYQADYIDPDLFWDEDGKVYLTSAGIYQTTVDLKTGSIGEQINIWNGTGGPYPEGPHIYKKDGYYYLVISEGGTELGHMVTVARSKHIAGPYDSYKDNPVLTNRNTTEYFQTVGHSDLFQDAKGNWWAMALSTRCGPEWKNYPMGREGILTPVTWKKGQWPVFEPVRGVMEGWQLPRPNRNLPGKGPFLGEPDVEDFRPGTSIPPQFSTWRWAQKDFFTVSPRGRPNTLRIKPSQTINLNGNSSAGQDGISLLMRLQTDTYFQYSVDFSYQPKAEKEEAGVTVFLTQEQHIDLSIVLLKGDGKNAKLAPYLRLRSVGKGNYEGDPILITKPITQAWLSAPISLMIEAKSDTHYTFSAASSRSRDKRQVLGQAPATIVSGGTGPFTGSLVGSFASGDGGNGKSEAYISRWRYYGKGQKIR